MVQVILVEQREDFAFELKRALYYYLNLTCVIRKTTDSTLPLLDFFLQAKTIIGNATIPRLDLIDQKVSTIKNRATLSYFYEQSDDISHIIKKISSDLNLDLDLDLLKEKHHLKDQHVHVPIEYFEKMPFSPCDVFIRIGKGKAAHYVKRIKKLDEVDDEVLGKLIKSNVSYLYVHIDDHEIFLTALTNQMIDGMTREEMEVNARMGHQAQAFSYLRKATELLDFDNRFIEVLDQSIESVQTSLQKDRPLSHLIKELMSRKDSLAFQNYYLTNLICFHLLSKLGLSHGDNLSNLITASTFADIGVDDPRIMYINSMEDYHEKQDELTPVQKELILNHAKINSTWTEQIPNIGKKISQLIREHHGSVAGVGFETQQSSKLSDISRVFVIANSFIKYFLNPKYQFNKKVIIEQMQSRYHDPLYEAVIKQLATKIE